MLEAWRLREEGRERKGDSELRRRRMLRREGVAAAKFIRGERLRWTVIKKSGRKDSSQFRQISLFSIAAACRTRKAYVWLANVIFYAEGNLIAWSTT
jgi:hypothetical protein